MKIEGLDIEAPEKFVFDEIAMSDQQLSLENSVRYQQKLCSCELLHCMFCAASISSI